MVQTVSLIMLRTSTVRSNTYEAPARQEVRESRRERSSR
jgi:hypothetical protein